MLKKDPPVHLALAIGLNLALSFSCDSSQTDMRGEYTEGQRLPNSDDSPQISALTNTNLIIPFNVELGDAPVPQKILLSRFLGIQVNNLNWTIDSNIPWLNISTLKGKGDAEISFNPEINGLTPGRWVSNFTISTIKVTGKKVPHAIFRSHLI